MLPVCVIVGKNNTGVNRCMSDRCHRPVVYMDLGLCDLCYQRALSYTLHQVSVDWCFFPFNLARFNFFQEVRGVCRYWFETGMASASARVPILGMQPNCTSVDKEVWWKKAQIIVNILYSVLLIHNWPLSHVDWSNQHISVTNSTLLLMALGTDPTADE